MVERLIEFLRAHAVIYRAPLITFKPLAEQILLSHIFTREPCHLTGRLKSLRGVSHRSSYEPSENARTFRVQRRAQLLVTVWQRRVAFDVTGSVPSPVERDQVQTPPDRAVEVIERRPVIGA